jgi:hypothetical protein
MNIIICFSLFFYLTLAQMRPLFIFLIFFPRSHTFLNSLSISSVEHLEHPSIISIFKLLFTIIPQQ